MRKYNAPLGNGFFYRLVGPQQHKGTQVRKKRPQTLLFRIKRQARRIVQKMQGKQFVHFLHIGKTGGSAVKYAIRKHYSAASSCYVIRLHPHGVKLRDVPNGESAIFLLRDPISRFVSGFNSRQRQGQPRYFSPWSPDEIVAFEHFNTPNQLALALSSPDTEQKRKAKNAMRSINHVRSSYWEWFESEQYFESRWSDIFFIGFQEHLSEDFDILKKKLGLPDSARLPEGDIAAHRNPKNLDETLEDEAIANLNNWYKDDFTFISLCKRIILENPALGSSTVAAQQGDAPDRYSANAP